MAKQFQDLGAFLSFLEERSELVRVREEVDAALEMSGDVKARVDAMGSRLGISLPGGLR